MLPEVAHRARAEVVEYPGLNTSPQEFIDYVTPDEPGPTGHEGARDATHLRTGTSFITSGLVSRDARVSYSWLMRWIELPIENCSLALFSAAAPSWFRSFSSASSLMMAFARSRGCLLFTSNPQSPRASGTPPTAVATTALPQAIASMIEKGNPSVIPLKTTRSPAL